MGEMIISAVAIRKARKLANGYRSPIPPHCLFFFQKNKKIYFISDWLSTSFYNRAKFFYLIEVF